MMQGTCNPKKCAFLKKVLKEKNPEGCPNYIESLWTRIGENQPIVIKDCAPRRTVLICQDLINSNLGMQQAHEQMRNRSDSVLMLVEEAAKRANLKAAQRKMQITEVNE